MDRILTLLVPTIIHFEKVPFPKQSFNEKSVSDFIQASEKTCNFVDSAFCRLSFIGKIEFFEIEILLFETLSIILFCICSYITVS